MMKGILFVLSGPSGTGKGTVCKKLLEREDIFLSVSATTRSRREGETEGVTYHYVTKDEFKKMIDEDEMLEYAEYNGNYYGTPKRSVVSLLDAGRDVLLEIEPQGALKIKQMFPEAVLIFLVPPSMKMLKERLITRGRESMEEIDKRIAASRWELQQADKYNKQIVNDDLDICVDEVMAYITEKRSERMMVKSLIDEKV
ncbi:MAG: guanylate kinase [Clostridia bacterium]|nr:guanylate kinase [Clostridia bacterium]